MSSEVVKELTFPKNHVKCYYIVSQCSVHMQLLILYLIVSCLWLVYKY